MDDMERWNLAREEIRRATEDILKTIIKNGCFTALPAMTESDFRAAWSDDDRA